MPACSSLKIAYQSGPASRSMAATAPLASPAPYMAPGRKQGRGQIGDRAADRLRQIAARGGILLVLERVHAEHQFGRRGRSCRPARCVRHISRIRRYRRRPAATGRCGRAVRRSSDRSLSAVAVIGGGGGGIALLAGMAGGQIAARGRHPGKVQRGRRLGGNLDRRGHQESGKRGAENAPGEARRRHGLCSNGADDRGLYANRRGWAENGLFAPPPQERQPRRPDLRLKAPMWQHRGRSGRRFITYSDNSARRRLRAEPR